MDPDRDLRNLGTGLLIAAVLAGLAAAAHTAIVLVAGNPFTDLKASWAVATASYNRDAAAAQAAGVALVDPGLLTVAIIAAIALGLAVIVTVVFVISRAFSGRNDAGLGTARDFRRRTRGVKKADLSDPLMLVDGKKVQIREEDTISCLSITGAGKTMRVVVRFIRSARGPLLSTATKPDVLRLTAWFRSWYGTVRVYDPEGVSRFPYRTKWDIVAGCEVDQEAMDRGNALVATQPSKGDKNSDFFTLACQSILRCYLHAAAVDGRTFRDVVRWASDFGDETPFDILRNHPDARADWVKVLIQYTRGESEQTVNSTQQSLGNILLPFQIEEILDSVCPNEGDDVFDSSNFHDTRDTLYLLTRSGGSALAAPVITTLVESVQKAAMRAATRTKSGRISPVLTNALDEVANICPIPSLPSLMSDGRGHGIRTLAVAQNRAQFVSRFGKEGADTIVNNSAMLVVFGGLKDTDHLRELSELAGDRDIQRTSTSHSENGSSTSISEGEKRVLTVNRMFTLPDGHATVIYRSLRPTIAVFPAWWEEKNRKDYSRSETHVLALEGHDRADDVDDDELDEDEWDSDDAPELKSEAA